MLKFEEIDKKTKEIENRILGHDRQLYENKQEQQELNSKINENRDSADNRFDEVEKKLREKFHKLIDKQAHFEKDTIANFSNFSKELERMKFELSDVIDGKFETI